MHGNHARMCIDGIQLTVVGVGPDENSVELLAAPRELEIVVFPEPDALV